jgi:hypothetical protein
MHPKYAWRYHHFDDTDLYTELGLGSYQDPDLSLDSVLVPDSDANTSPDQDSDSDPHEAVDPCPE